MSNHTPTEEAILNVLSDGMPHTREELHTCLPDPLSAISAIQPHISHLRSKLVPIGHDIVCEFRDRQYMYRWIRLLTGGPP